MIQKIISLLSQLLPVAIGVFFGIWVSNWNEARLQKAQQIEMLGLMVEELKENQKNLERAIPYHEKIGKTVDSLTSHLPEEILLRPIREIGGPMAIPGWVGINMPLLQNSVYESAVISGSFSGLEFTLLQSFSKNQEMLKIYGKFIELILDRLSNLRGDDTYLVLMEQITVIGYDIVQMEENMVEMFGETIVLIEERLKDE
ncbi:MAG: hypothetical protein AAGH79_06165, partial [Bacteroidota bacterium]